MTEQPSLLPGSAGEILRSERLRQGLSLRAVAETLRCPESLLRSIENDQPVNLAPVYLRGHLRRYADHLALDGAARDELLAHFEDPAPTVQTVFEKRPRAQAGDRWLRAASYALASLLVGTLAWQLTHEAVRLTSLDKPAVDSENVAGTVVAEARPGHINASIAAFERLGEPSGTRLGSAGADGWRAIASANAPQPTLIEGAHRLVVETSADSWVEITEASGKRLEQDLLRGGERRQYQGEGPFQISLGRSSAVQLRFDGRLIDLEPYTRDDVARLLLDPEVLQGSTPEAVPGLTPLATPGTLPETTGEQAAGGTGAGGTGPGA